MRGMTPVDRAALLVQHEHLRSLMAQAETAGQALLAEERPSNRAATALQSAIHALRAGLLPHLADEEAALLPRLGALPDGALRAALLKAEHTSERALLDLLSRVSEAGLVVCARRLVSFVGELRQDMRFEEQELFAAAFEGGPHATPG